MTDVELQKLHRTVAFWRQECAVAERNLIRSHGELGRLKAWARTAKARTELRNAEKNLREAERAA